MSANADESDRFMVPRLHSDAASGSADNRDYTLFYAGMFPESINHYRLQRQHVEGSWIG